MFAIWKLGDGIRFRGVGADEMPRTQSFGQRTGQFDSIEECVRHVQGQEAEYSVKVYKGEMDYVLIAVDKNNPNLVFGVYQVTELALLKDER